MEHHNKQPLTKKNITKIVSLLDLKITLTEAKQILNLTKQISTIVHSVEVEDKP